METRQETTTAQYPTPENKNKFGTFLNLVKTWGGRFANGKENKNEENTFEERAQPPDGYGSHRCILTQWQFQVKQGQAKERQHQGVRYQKRSCVRNVGNTEYSRFILIRTPHIVKIKTTYLLHLRSIDTETSRHFPIQQQRQCKWVKIPPATLKNLNNARVAKPQHSVGLKKWAWVKRFNTERTMVTVQKFKCVFSSWFLGIVFAFLFMLLETQS